MFTVCEDGETATVNFGGAFTTSVALVVCVSVPLVPVIVRLDVPVGVDAAVVTVRVDDPVAGFGLNEAVALAEA